MPTGVNRFRTLYHQDVEETFKSIDINSREELQELGREESIDINWTLWDSLVEKTKQDIKDSLDKYQPKKRYKGNHNPIRSVYLYDLDKHLIKVFETPQEAGNYFHINPIQVNHYIRNNIPYYKRKVMFTMIPIEEEDNEAKT